MKFYLSLYQSQVHMLKYYKNILYKITLKKTQFKITEGFTKSLCKLYKLLVLNQLERTVLNLIFIEKKYDCLAD